MHAMRWAICGAAAVGAFAVVFPWVTLAEAGGKVAIWGYQHKFAIYCSVCLGLAILPALAGGMTKRLPPVMRIAVFFLSGIALAASTYDYLQLKGVIAAGVVEKFASIVLWPGYGIFLAFTSSLTLLALVLVGPFFLKDRVQSVTEAAS